MAGKQQRVTEAIRQAVLQGQPGFTDRLPSYRDLATRFNVSTFVVYNALKTLDETDQLISCRPRRNAVVRRGRRQRQPSNQRATAGTLICETLPEQIEFWQTMIARFEILHPEFHIRPCFSTSLASARSQLQDGLGERWVVIRVSEEDLATAGPMLPLSQVLGPETLAELNADISAAPRTAAGLALPYQLQLPGIVVAPSAPAKLPKLPWSWPQAAAWMHRNCGEQSFGLPVLYALLESCGIGAPAPGTGDFGISRQVLVDLADACAALVSEGVFVPTGYSDDLVAELFTDRRLRAVCNMSFNWRRLGLGIDPEVQVLPMPQGRHSVTHTDPVSAFATGHRDNPAADAWFRFLFSPEFQSAQMQWAFGISPRRSCREQMLAEPDHYPAGLAALAAQPAISRHGFGRVASSPEWEAFRGSLFARILSPLLSGEISQAAGRRTCDAIINELQGRKHELLQSERQRLLREAFQAGVDNSLAVSG